jgi:hypothetical protein
MANEVQLCVHRSNPRACPVCYRILATAPRAPAAATPATIGQVIPIGEATLRATQNAARMRIQNPAANAGNARALKEPFQSANFSPPPEAFDPDKLWQPPAHPSQIDSRSVHPHLHASKTIPR